MDTRRILIYSKWVADLNSTNQGAARRRNVNEESRTLWLLLKLNWFSLFQFLKRPISLPCQNLVFAANCRVMAASFLALLAYLLIPRKKVDVAWYHNRNGNHAPGRRYVLSAGGLELELWKSMQEGRCEPSKGSYLSLPLQANYSSFPSTGIILSVVSPQIFWTSMLRDNTYSQSCNEWTMARLFNRSKLPLRASGNIFIAQCNLRQLIGYIFTPALMYESAHVNNRTPVKKHNLTTDRTAEFYTCRICIDCLRKIAEDEDSNVIADSKSIEE